MAHDAGLLTLPDGYTIHRYDSLDGTNAEALRRADARHGDVFVADRQTAGRGRAGREWQSPPGNLYATMLAVPPASRNPAQLAFVAALGVHDALAAAAPEARFSLKWPNDVLCGGRKLSGVLIEAGEAGYAVGVGINLIASPPDDEVRFPATNLQAATGTAVARDDMLASLCGAFDGWFVRWRDEGFGPLRRAWLAYGHRIGDTLSVSTRDRTIDGRFDGLDEDGALIVRDPAGVEHAITAGDVFFAGDA